MATHNHVADPRMVTAEIKKAKLRKRAQRSHTKLRKLFSEMVQHLPNDVTGFLPAPRNMARTAVLNGFGDYTLRVAQHMKIQIPFLIQMVARISSSSIQFLSLVQSAL